MTEIVPLDHLALSVAPWAWPFATARRAEIDAHFAARCADTPELWNGRILLVNRWAISWGFLIGVCFETDFASFLAWRDWGFPDPAVTNCFAMGAIRSADGAFLLGVMGAHTANAGKIYFPAGTPDRDDIVGERLDLEGSILREVAEETGLTADDFVAEPGWRAVLAGPRVAIMKILAAHDDAEALRERILDHLRREEKPELADVRIVRSAADLNPNMPEFVSAFLTHVWRGADENVGPQHDPTLAF